MALSPSSLGTGAGLSSLRPLLERVRYAVPNARRKAAVGSNVRSPAPCACNCASSVAGSVPPTSAVPSSATVIPSCFSPTLFNTLSAVRHSFRLFRVAVALLAPTANPVGTSNRSTVRTWSGQPLTSSLRYRARIPPWTPQTARCTGCELAGSLSSPSAPRRGCGSVGYLLGVAHHEAVSAPTGVQPQWATGRAIGPTPQFAATLMGESRWVTCQPSAVGWAAVVCECVDPFVATLSVTGFPATRSMSRHV